LLAFDTATETMHVALLAGEQLRVAALSGGAQASATAMPGVQAMLADAGLAWADVQAVAFGQGPGAFTGLRTACALAQGLALALDVPVVPLDTLMAVAESARLRSPALAAWLVTPAAAAAEPPCLWVLQDARMQEVYAAAYAWSAEHGWCVREPASLWCLVELQSHIQTGHVHWAAGSALAAYPAHTQGLANADPVACPEGAALAVLAQSAWHRGQCVDAALALPVYVRDKVAQTTQERTQARDAAVALDAARHT
jgi:tRNA threonylcarbamoyladenosine biosynthesis protein TsaB